MSTNQTSSTYQAVDKLRPAEAFTLAFPGTPSRLNLFLQHARPLQFGCGHRQRQLLDRRPDRRCPRVSGVGVRLLLQAVRPARHGRSRDRGRQHRAPALRDRKPTGSRRISSARIINNAFYCCDGLLVFGDGDGRIFNFLAGGFDVVAHEWTHGVTDFTSQLIYRDESGALERSVLGHHGRGDGVLLPAGGQRPRSGRLADRRGRRTSLPPGYLRSLSNPDSQRAPRPLQPSPLSSARIPTTAACTST